MVKFPTHGECHASQGRPREMQDLRPGIGQVKRLRKQRAISRKPAARPGTVSKESEDDAVDRHHCPRREGL